MTDSYGRQWGCLMALVSLRVTVKTVKAGVYDDDLGVPGKGGK